VLIRTKLLLLGLATLALPWAGCQYVREVEGSLRVAESQSLLAVARRSPPRCAAVATCSSGARPAPRAAARPGISTSSRCRSPRHRNSTAATTTGRREARDPPALSPRPGEMLEVRTATFERYLYLFVAAPGDLLVLDAGDDARARSGGLGDRVWLAFTIPTGAAAAVRVAAGPGAVRGRRIATRELGRRSCSRSRASRGRGAGGADGRTRRGWRLELQLPLSMLGERFGVLLDDRDRRGADAISYGSLYTHARAARPAARGGARAARLPRAASASRHADRRRRPARRRARRSNALPGRQRASPPAGPAVAAVPRLLATHGARAARHRTRNQVGSTASRRARSRPARQRARCSQSPGQQRLSSRRPPRCSTPTSA
jgi:hypothetical protein